MLQYDLPPLPDYLLIHEIAIIRKLSSKTPSVSGLSQQTEAALGTRISAHIQTGVKNKNNLPRDATEATHVVFINYPGFVPSVDCVVVFEDRKWRILSAQNMLEANVWLTIYCKEVQ